MIKHWLVTGDTHSHNAERLKTLESKYPDFKPEETALIILGDAGFQFYKNMKSWKIKHETAKLGYTLYCLRGNHEDRIANCPNAIKEYDEDVHGFIYYEPEFSNIKYFEDIPAAYQINGHSVLTIPGAYSVDKWYRLAMSWTWFPQEQLTAEEMEQAEKKFGDYGFDFVLSHTCPLFWEPTDLFLNGIDQSKVDKSMEIWLDKFKDKIMWGIWLFGHYHADRLERPYVEQFYTKVENMEDVYNRWMKFEETGELDWHLPKSPMFHS